VRAHRHQKGKTILDFNEARDDGWQWYQQIIGTSLQTGNHASTSLLGFYRPMLFLPCNQQRQSIW